MDKSAPKENQEEEEEETALEVEKVLLAKLQSGLVSNASSSSIFRSCNELLEEKLRSRMDRKGRIRFRRRLHLLNNLLAEHDSVWDTFSSCFGFRLKQIRDDIKRDPKDIKRDPKDIKRDPKAERKQREGPTERVPSRATPTASHGFNVDLMAAENLLLCRDVSPEFNTAAICGPEGVGKTTLAQVVFHSEKARSMFLPRIWICLAANPDDEDDAQGSAESFLTRRILLQLGFDRESVKDVDRSEIRSALLGRRYLIVLDGASEDLDYNKRMMQMLRDTLPKGTGGAVIVTGRAEDVVSEMVEEGGANAVHRLLPLDKPVVCWDIYLTAAEEKEAEMKDLDEKQKVKNEVVKRSDGLPWASTLLGILRRVILEKKLERPPQATPT